MTDEPSGRVILYQRDDGAPAIQVHLDAETVWLSQQQIAELFQTSRTNIVEHIQHIYDEGELGEAATCRKSRQARTEGSRQVAREIPFYNLDLIISVGYRVKSKLATQFRIWATERLRDYLVQGYAINEERLEHLGSQPTFRAAGCSARSAAARSTASSARSPRQHTTNHEPLRPQLPPWSPWTVSRSQNS